MGRKPEPLKDRELLNLLSQNARTPLTEIAKKMNVSRATVQSRLARLERDRYIVGYTIISGIDPGIIELISAIILIQLEARAQKKLISNIKLIPEVISCHTTSGHHDLLLRVQCESPSALDGIIDKISHMEGVRRTTSSILLSRKFER